MLTLGQQIYLKRRERGWSQAELAQKADLSQPNLSDIEKGKQDLTVSTLRRIAWALETPVKSFFEEEAGAISLSREKIERLAKAIVSGKKNLAPADQKIAGLLKLLQPARPKGRAGVKEMHQAWLELKQILSDRQIRSLCERVRDETMRQS